jgi:hypothetical protein
MPRQAGQGKQIRSGKGNINRVFGLPIAAGHDHSETLDADLKWACVKLSRQHECSTPLWLYLLGAEIQPCRLWLVCLMEPWLLEPKQGLHWHTQPKCLRYPAGRCPWNYRMFAISSMVLPTQCTTHYPSAGVILTLISCSQTHHCLCRSYSLSGSSSSIYAHISLFHHYPRNHST